MPKVEYNLGEIIKMHRKLKKLSLNEFGDLIGKTKSTVCRYESNEIIPDCLVILEICEALNLDITEFYNTERKIKECSMNPFKTDKLYLYYIGFSKKLVTSSIEIINVNGEYKVVLKNAINRNDNENNAYSYSGVLESNGIVTFINLKNAGDNKKFERIQITINNQFAHNDCYYGNITATKNDNLPTNRKCMICSKSVDEMSREEKKEIFERLKISKKELENIKKNFYWDPELRKEEEYFIEIN